MEAIKMQRKEDEQPHAWILIGAVIAAMCIFFALQMTPLAVATTTNTFTANVLVSGVCYASASPNPLSFGTISPGTSLWTNTVITDSDVNGNGAAYVWIKGTDWAYLSNTIAVGDTLWSQSAMGSYAGNALTTTFANTFVFMPAPTIAGPTTSNSLYFGLSVPGGEANGVYTQTMTFNNVCTAPASNSITANVLVPATCFTALSPNAITFGVLVPGSSSNTNVLVTDSDTGGNAQATLYVEGSDLTYLSNTISVANTLWNPTSVASYTGNALTGGFASTGIILIAPTLGNPTTSNSVYFGVRIPGGTPIGTYTQTVTIENSC